MRFFFDIFFRENYIIFIFLLPKNYNKKLIKRKSYLKKIPLSFLLPLISLIESLLIDSWWLSWFKVWLLLKDVLILLLDLLISGLLTLPELGVEFDKLLIEFLFVVGWLIRDFGLFVLICDNDFYWLF